MQLTKHKIEQPLLDLGLPCISRRSVHALDPTLEPPLGAHMLTPRRGYTHHGIYVGRGRVVHYRGLSRGLRRGPVEEVSMHQFSRGRPIRIRAEVAISANPEEVVRRARLRVGENRYRVFTNNCEHFCEWCIRGEPRSYQVDALTAACRGMWQAFIWLLNHVRCLRSFKARGAQPRAAYATLSSLRSIAEQIAVHS